MQFVYLMKSSVDPKKRYVGLTHDLNSALIEHNSGKLEPTRDDTPWQIDVAIRFDNHRSAADFARYLHSPAGKSYSKKHFWD